MVLTAGSRFTERRRWVRLVWIVLAAVVVLAASVVAARNFRGTPAGHDFLSAFPGASTLPASAPNGFPAWLGWQHFLNVFFLVLIVKSGWLVRTQTRPPAFWTRKNQGPIRTKRPPKRISINLWLHLSLDTLWVLNGIVFIVVLLSTGQWMRIVPTNWDVFPNAVSAGIQYLSFQWPVEDAWSNYNALQLLAYFVTVFVAAPTAFITGIRMSPAWPSQAKRLSRAYPVELARAVHVPVMFYFVVFVIVHVTLVFSTGALRNLNHMFAGRSDEGWLGFWIFAASLVAIVLAWCAARPLILQPIAALSGRVGR